MTGGLSLLPIYIYEALGVLFKELYGPVFEKITIWINMDKESEQF